MAPNFVRTQRSWISIRALVGVALISSLGACSDGETIQDPVPTTNTVDTIGGLWAAVTELPLAVQEAAVAVYREKIYVVGGEGIVNVIGAGPLCCGGYATVQRYDPVTNTTERLGDLPQERDRLALAVLDDTLYAIGGQFNNPAMAGGTVATVWVYLPDTDDWVERTPLPEPRNGAAAVAANGQLFVIGGVDGASRAAGDSIVIYDPATGLWRHGAPLLGGLVNATAHFVNGLVYVVGGHGPTSTFDRSSTVYTYDPATDGWATVTITPGSNHSYSSAVLGGRLHLIGGRSDSPAASEFHRVFDFTTGEFLQAPELLRARRDHRSVVVGDALYVLTGSLENEQNPTATVDMYRLP